MPLRGGAQAIRLNRFDLEGLPHVCCSHFGGIGVDYVLYHILFKSLICNLCEREYVVILAILHELLDGHLPCSG